MRNRFRKDGGLKRNKKLDLGKQGKQFENREIYWGLAKDIRGTLGSAGNSLASLLVTNIYYMYYFQIF